MNHTIWKFVLVPDPQGDMLARVKMPKGARVISVGCQDKDLIAWARVDPEAPQEERKLWCLFTGQYWPEALEGRDRHFYGTTTVAGLVFHVFEALPKPDESA